MSFNLRDITPKDTKKKLNVLEAGETRRQKLWDQCISEARTLVSSYKNIRFQVVDLVEKCCVVHRGGRAVNARYTVAKFAKEIGIAEGTLYEWIRIKRVRDGLPDPDKFSYEDLRLIDKETVAIKDPEKKKNALLKSAKAFSSFSPETVKMRKYIKHLKSVHFNASNLRLIKDCDSETIGEVVHLCREIVRMLAPFDRKQKSQSQGLSLKK